VLKDVTTELTLSDRFDKVRKETGYVVGAQERAQEPPLCLLRALLGLPLKAGDPVAKVRDSVLAILYLQVPAGVCLTESISASLFDPSGDSPLRVEGEFALLVAKLLFFRRSASAVCAAVSF
jgi:hypothetical protein